MRKDDNITFMKKMMSYSSAGALIHPFIFTALEYYSKVILAKEDLDTGMVNPEAWKLCAREVLAKLDKHLNHDPNGCPCCGAAVGKQHERNCDIPTCPACGHSLYKCDCPSDIIKDMTPVPWSGRTPASMACMEYDLYGKWAGQAFVPCSGDEDGAEEDLDRLFREGTWNQAEQRWEMPDGNKRSAAQ